MRRLRQTRQVAGDARLARGEVLEEVGVERQNGELVQAHQPRDQLENQQSGLELQLRLRVLHVLCKQRLGKALGVVQQVEGREVEGVRGVLLLLLLLDLLGSLLQIARLLLGLLVDARLMAQLGHVHVFLVAAVVGGLLALLVAAQEEAHPSCDDFFVLAQRGQAHDLDGARVGPDLLLP